MSSLFLSYSLLLSSYFCAGAAASNIRARVPVLKKCVSFSPFLFLVFYSALSLKHFLHPLHSTGGTIRPCPHPRSTALFLLTLLRCTRACSSFKSFSFFFCRNHHHTRYCTLEIIAI